MSAQAATAKVLSIRQPWAWLIVQGYKDIENRSWRTNYRGPFLVHAGKTLDPDYTRLRGEFAEQGIDVPPASEIDRGGIVGRAEIIECVRESASAWFSGPYGFVPKSAEPLRFIPFRARLGLFDVTLTAL